MVNVSSSGQTWRYPVPERTPVAAPSRERLMQLVQGEMAAFEQREAAYRKKEREERVSLLNLPKVSNDHLAHLGA